MQTRYRLARRRQRGGYIKSPNHIIDQALAHQKAGRIEAAQSLYQELLTTNKQNHAALHLLGVLKYQRHDYKNAEDLLTNAIRLNPGNPTYHYHLSFVRRDTGRTSDAIAGLKHAIFLKPRFFDAQFNLAILLEKTGNLSSAEDHYRMAILSGSTHVKSYNLLGKLLWKRGHIRDGNEAEACFRMATKLAPNMVDGHLNLADHFYFRKKPIDAAAQYRHILKLDPTNPTAQHMLQTIEGRERINVAADYATQHFTPYTHQMENALKGRLDFRTPEKLRRLVGEFLQKQWELSGIELPVKDLDIMDLGCGDGINGTLYRGISRNLVGCDLSPQLLKVAQEKGIYDSLENQGAVNYLRRNNALYDVIIASDILIYVGALEGIFAGAAQRIQPAGLFAFTIEKQTGRDYTIGDNGRFTHNPAYILKLSAQNAFTPLIQHDTILRKNEQGYDAEGSLFVIQKNT